MKRIAESLKAFGQRLLKDEDGSQTIEAVIWVPIFVTVLALVVDVSLVFFDQSQILLVVQDANRALSLGKFDDSAQVEAYVSENLQYLSDAVSVEAEVIDGFVTTTVTVPAMDLMPVRMPGGYFADTTVTVVAKHLLEV